MIKNMLRDQLLRRISIRFKEATQLVFVTLSLILFLCKNLDNQSELKETK